MKRFVQWFAVVMAVVVLAPAAFGQFLFRLNPSELDFGMVATGDTKTMDAELVFNGSQQAILISGWMQNSPFGNADQFTVRVSTGDSAIIMPGDTVRISVEYHPTEAGPHQAQYSFNMMGISQTLTLMGGMEEPTGLTTKQSACADIEVGTTGMCSMTFTNNTDTDMRLIFEGVDAPFAFTSDGGITFVNGLNLAPGESADVPVAFTPTEAGLSVDEFTVTNGTETMTVVLQGTGIVPSTGNGIVFSPDVVDMTVGDASETATATVTLTNNGQLPFNLSVVEIEGPDASAFAVATTPLPVSIGARDSYDVTVTFTPNDTQTEYRARLAATGGVNAFLGITVYADLVGIVGRTPGTDTIRVGLANTGGAIGETASIVFTNQSTIPSNIAYGHATLRYNASVLVPQDEMIDDVIDHGMRTSTFRIEPSSRLAGTTLAAIKFTITLGDAHETPVELVGMTWYDEQNTQLNTETFANGAVVSVEDAEGRTVNANGDIMTLSAFPMPVVGDVTISYLRTPGAARLSMFNAMGVEVMDLSSYLNGAPEQGSIQVGMSTLPAGTYYMRLSVGTSTVVRRIVKN